MLYVPNIVSVILLLISGCKVCQIVMGNGINSLLFSGCNVIFWPLWGQQKLLHVDVFLRNDFKLKSTNITNKNNASELNTISNAYITGSWYVGFEIYVEYLVHVCPLREPTKVDALRVAGFWEETSN